MAAPANHVPYDKYWAMFGMTDREICFFPSQQKRRQSTQLHLGRTAIDGTCQVSHHSSVLNPDKHRDHTSAIQDAIHHADGFVLTDTIFSYAEAVACSHHKSEHLADSMRAKAYLLARSLREAPSELQEDVEDEEATQVDPFSTIFQQHTPRSSSRKKARRQSSATAYYTPSRAMHYPPRLSSSAMVGLFNGQHQHSGQLSLSPPQALSDVPLNYGYSNSNFPAATNRALYVNGGIATAAFGTPLGDWDSQNSQFHTPFNDAPNGDLDSLNSHFATPVNGTPYGGADLFGASAVQTLLDEASFKFRADAPSSHVAAPGYSSLAGGKDHSMSEGAGAGAVNFQDGQGYGTSGANEGDGGGDGAPLGGANLFGASALQTPLNFGNGGQLDDAPFEFRADATSSHVATPECDSFAGGEVYSMSEEAGSEAVDSQDGQDCGSSDATEGDGDGNAAAAEAIHWNAILREAALHLGEAPAVGGEIR
ncbi:hypothetical protein CERZMDRAFT_88103 [Cercospora zeae-maydis SCOH1-5]|uniref:Uncharacterized protein n=1 Tax=Cercospora zeae-maydis SCOH1-5 TaxID=717836 RepID=A0A6A6F618_9PEZI|nr:hypothetical protein CERZMDRAFT_88103 [Cercospora zeae-maydis SCOH1-5]